VSVTHEHVATFSEAFVDLASAWNGFDATNSFLLGGDGGFRMSTTLLFDDVSQPHAVLDCRTNPQLCRTEQDPKSEATKSGCSGWFALGVQGGQLTASYAPGGLPANMSVSVSAPVTAKIWHALEMSVVHRVVAASPAGVVSDWTLTLDGELKGHAIGAPPVHRGIPAFAVLGKGALWPGGGHAPAPFVGSVAEFTVAPNR